MRPGHPLQDEARCLLSSSSLKPKRQSRESYSKDVKVLVGTCCTQNCFIWEFFDCHICLKSQNWAGRRPFNKIDHEDQEEAPTTKNHCVSTTDESESGRRTTFSISLLFFPHCQFFVDHWSFWEAINLFLAQFNLKHNNTPAITLASPQIMHGKYIREPLPVTQLTKAYGIIDGLHWDKMNMEKVEHLVVVLN